MTTRIDLTRHRTGQSRVFAGRDRGEAIRKAANIPCLEKAGESIAIVIPDDVVIVNTSFFLGLLGESVRELGASAFRKRYVFSGPILDEVISEGIELALRNDSPLP